MRETRRGDGDLGLQSPMSPSFDPKLPAFSDGNTDESYSRRTHTQIAEYAVVDQIHARCLDPGASLMRMADARGSSKRSSPDASLTESSRPSTPTPGGIDACGVTSGD